MSIELITWLLPLPPFLAFVVIMLGLNRSNRASQWTAIGAAFLTFLGSIYVFFTAVTTDHFYEHPIQDAIAWLPLGEGVFEIGVLVDPLTAIMLFFVSTCVLAIFVYSSGYHNYGQPKGDHDLKGFPPHGATEDGHAVPSIEPMFARFFAFIGLFATGMFVLIISDNLLTLFAGWEIMGLCSYLLIGFWFGKESARDAAKKAFMTTRVGDVFMLLGIAYLYSATGTLSFRAIFAEETIHHLLEMDSGVFGWSAATLIGILLFIGTMGKSAQFPLHVWLPDAMEGPTPVSAMIHAATMVSAGVYMIIRMFPLLSAGWHGHDLTTTMMFMAFIGSFTALFAATIAIAQNDVKAVLAYSTISQLGFMVAALGIGAYVAAVFHLMTHAFFKALLFLGSGSVIHGMEHGVLHTGDHSVDPQDMYNMGGLRKKMPRTYYTFLIGGLALSGFPFITAGFWSKDEILADAWAHGHTAVFIALALAALMTAFYTARQIQLTFGGEPRTEEAKHAHETPLSMTGPLMALAFFAVTIGWIGIPDDFMGTEGVFTNWLHGFVAHGLPEWLHLPELHFDWIPLITSLVVALGGLSLGWFMYKGIKAGDEDPVKKILPAFLFNAMRDKYYFDELYDKILIKPAVWFSEKVVYMFMDRKLIDGALHGIARVTFWLGGVFRDKFDTPIINEFFGDTLAAGGTHKMGEILQKTQSGKIQQYMVWTMGIALVGLFFFLATLQ